MLTPIKAHLEYYRSQHKTLGCRLTHLFGVPIIAISIPMMLFNFRKGLALFSFGWLLQFIGHFVFEHNKPILLTRGRSPFTLISALLFVGQEWVETVRSVSEELLLESDNGKGELPAPGSRSRSQEPE